MSFGENLGTNNLFAKIGDGPISNVVLVGNEVSSHVTWSDAKNTFVPCSKDEGGKYRFGVLLWSIDEQELKILSGTYNMACCIKEGLGSNNPDDTIITISKTGTGRTTKYPVTVEGKISSDELEKIKKKDLSLLEARCSWAFDGQSDDDALPF